MVGWTADTVTADALSETVNLLGIALRWFESIRLHHPLASLATGSGGWIRSFHRRSLRELGGKSESIPTRTLACASPPYPAWVRA